MQQAILFAALIHKAVVIFTCDLDGLGDRLRDSLGLFLPSLVVLVFWISDPGEALEGLHKLDAALQTLFLLRTILFLVKSGQLSNVVRLYQQLSIHLN